MATTKKPNSKTFEDIMTLASVRSVYTHPGVTLPINTKLVEKIDQKVEALLDSLTEPKAS